MLPIRATTTVASGNIRFNTDRIYGREMHDRIVSNLNFQTSVQ